MSRMLGMLPLFGLLLAVLVGMVVVGGIKRIGCLCRTPCKRNSGCKWYTLVVWGNFPYNHFTPCGQNISISQPGTFMMGIRPRMRSPDS